MTIHCHTVLSFCTQIFLRKGSTLFPGSQTLSKASHPPQVPFSFSFNLESLISQNNPLTLSLTHCEYSLPSPEHHTTHPPTRASSMDELVVVDTAVERTRWRLPRRRCLRLRQAPMDLDCTVTGAQPLSSPFAAFVASLLPFSRRARVSWSSGSPPHPAWLYCHSPSLIHSLVSVYDHC